MRLNANDRNRPVCRVLHNRVDITDRCFEADDREGWAKVYIHGPDGKVMLNSAGTDVQWEILWGAVEFKMGVAVMEYATKAEGAD